MLGHGPMERSRSSRASGSCIHVPRPPSDAGLVLLRGVSRALEPLHVADAGVAIPKRPRFAAFLMELPAVLRVRSFCERSLAGGEYGGARYDAEHQGELACHGPSLWAAVLRTLIPVAVLRGVVG